MSVHNVAAEGFDKEAKTYEQSRPSYPPDVVSWLTNNLRIGAGSRVLDLAAGTGILTRLLVPSGCDLVAAEPVAGMRAQLRSVLPAVPCLSAVAESLPLRDASLDAVTIAQAFHWFDGPLALVELRRVLQIGGRAAMVWNARDRSRDWVDQVWAVMDRVEKHAPWRDHDQTATFDSQSRREDALNDTPGFGAVHTAQFRHEQPVTHEQVVQRVKGVSHVAVLEPTTQASVLNEVRDILTSHESTRDTPLLSIPYRVDCYWLQRVS